ncbi:MAG: hypothetical protein MZV63_07580 [Marinilabiliales bacterium]|nr:hypothetical protein [Marinilabiliales bacterium]
MTNEGMRLPVYIKAEHSINRYRHSYCYFCISAGAFLFRWFSQPLLAIVLHPVVNFFVKKKLNRVMAIILTLFLTFLVIAAFGALTDFTGKPAE